MASTIDRRLRILQLLPNRQDGQMTIPHLKRILAEDGFDVTDRTLQRDMEELCLSYPINCDESRKPYRWYWAGREALPIPALGQFTALTLHLAESLLKPLLPAQALDSLKPNFAAARRTLNENPRRKTRRWLAKIRVVPRSLRLEQAPVAKGIYPAITQALYDDKQIRVTYLAASSRDGAPKTYHIHPYALLHRDTVTELVGRIDGDDTTRRWVLHRFHKARPTDEPATIPPDFDLDRYIEQDMAYPLSGKAITLKARIKDDRQALYHVSETRIAEDQTIEPIDDGYLLTARTRETIELKWWILGMGDRIEVIEPASLRREIHRTVSATLKQYEP